MRLLALLIAISVTSSATAAGPTCALLDPEKAPRAALLEAKLLAEPNATWVERANIDKILAEQKLQAAFGPQGVGERVRLGKLLKADLLVMIRPVKGAEQPTLEVVVSETASGLRLLLRAVPVTKDSDADVAALLAAAKDGIRKYGEKVTEVVAVPPFVSQNLEFTHDHLKGAFAKLAEAEALGRKGVLVVELEEAEALAKEIALAAPGTTLARPLPVYLLGEFRHDGKGKDATVSVKLRAERGGKPIGKPEVAVVRSDESSATVRKWSAGILDALAKDDKPRPPANPKAEAKQLAERGLVLKRLGNWTECVALIEASLILDPAQPDLHAEAVKAITPLLDPTLSRACYAKPGERNADADLLARLYRRGLDHLDAFADKGGDFMKYRDLSGANMISSFRGGVNHLKPPGGAPHEAVLAVLRELKEDEKAVMARINPIIARQFRDRVKTPEPKRDDPAVRPAWYDPLAKPDPAAHRIRMTPIALTMPRPKAGTAPTKRLNGLVAAGPGADVIWAGQSIYLMSERGKLQPVWTSTDENPRFISVRFDGRFVWAAVRRSLEGPLLVVIDPASGKAYEVGGADGLPQPTTEQLADSTLTFPLTMATLGPGRVCVAGWLQRSWVAVVTFDPEKKRASVDLIHEAREAPDRDDKEQWSSTTVSFRPTFMLALRDKSEADEKVGTRVLLGRGTGANLGVDEFPLVIDPDNRTVGVAGYRVSSIGYGFAGGYADHHFAEDGTAVYRAERTINPRLLRFPFPGTSREVVAEGLPQGVSFLAFQGSRAHVIQELTEKADPKSPKRPLRGNRGGPVSFQWYVVEPGEKRPTLVGVDLPLIDYVAVSSHYGLVAIVAPERSSGAWTLQSVEFLDPKK
jgi:hypothetical protein